MPPQTVEISGRKRNMYIDSGDIMLTRVFLSPKIRRSNFFFSKYLRMGLKTPPVNFFENPFMLTTCSNGIFEKVKKIFYGQNMQRIVKIPTLTYKKCVLKHFLFLSNLLLKKYLGRYLKKITAKLLAGCY